MTAAASKPRELPRYRRFGPRVAAELRREARRAEVEATRLRAAAKAYQRAAAALDPEGER